MGWLFFLCLVCEREKALNTHYEDKRQAQLLGFRISLLLLAFAGISAACGTFFFRNGGMAA